jgi:hypothetical protein
VNIHPKVAAGGVTAAVTALVISLLIAYVPAFHTGVPLIDQQLIATAITALFGFIAAYAKKGPEQFTADNLVQHIRVVKAGIAGRENDLRRAQMELGSTGPGPGGNAYG